MTTVASCFAAIRSWFDNNVVLPYHDSNVEEQRLLLQFHYNEGCANVRQYKQLLRRKDLDKTTRTSVKDCLSEMKRQCKNLGKTIKELQKAQTQQSYATTLSEIQKGSKLAQKIMHVTGNTISRKASKTVRTQEVLAGNELKAEIAMEELDKAMVDVDASSDEEEEEDNEVEDEEQDTEHKEATHRLIHAALAGAPRVPSSSVGSEKQKVCELVGVV